MTFQLKGLFCLSWGTAKQSHCQMLSPGRAWAASASCPSAPEARSEEAVGKNLARQEPLPLWAPGIVSVERACSCALDLRGGLRGKLGGCPLCSPLRPSW